jgi:hypothetical protein
MFDCNMLPDCITGGNAIDITFPGPLEIRHADTGPWPGCQTLNAFDGVTPFTGGLVFHYVPYEICMDRHGHVATMDIGGTQNLTITFLT